MSRKYNREKSQIQNKKRKLARREFLFNYLIDKKCIECGFSNLLCFEFDHKDGTNKSNEIGEMVNRGVSEKTILEELNKCDLLCVNCHRIRTMKRGNFWRYAMALEKGLLI